MLVVSNANTYSFAYANVKINDTTIVQDEVVQATYPLPDFNILVPTFQSVGSTNALEIFDPGNQASYLAAHGRPNAIKYGFGPDFIHDVLAADAGVGVYTVNLRGADATHANAVVLMKYKVEKDVPYTSKSINDTGAEVTTTYYVDKNGQITDQPTDNEPMKRDVLHVKYELASVSDVHKWTDITVSMNQLAIDGQTEDENGYTTVPLFGVMYKGASDFGNNSYFCMNPGRAEYDGNMYYTVTAFDGLNTISTDNVLSLDLDAGAEYNTTYYIENQFNAKYPTLRFIGYEGIEDVYDIFKPYMFTAEESAQKAKEPAAKFAQFDIFHIDEYMIQMDEGSLDVSIPDAIRLSGGSDGTATRDELFKEFFEGKMLSVDSVLRYQINYIPDIGYDDETKKAIIDLVKRRNHMTTATIMIGGKDFPSALLDHQANYHDSMPNIRQIAHAQDAMRYNPFIRRTVVHPASYFDTISLVNHFKKWGNYYQPAAGAYVRWSDYIEDTMQYPTETPEFMTSLYNSRINVVMKDDQDGAYMSDQLMNTDFISDQTELNNAFLISAMLYDLIHLVHLNHFKFNEAEDVRVFTEAVNDNINRKYSQYSASLETSVSRRGTVGRARFTNIIRVRIDMKDISKFTDIELTLEDA